MRRVLVTLGATAFAAGLTASAQAAPPWVHGTVRGNVTVAAGWPGRPAPPSRYLGPPVRI